MVFQSLLPQHAATPREITMIRTALLVPTVLLVACSFGGCASDQNRKAATVESTEVVISDVTMVKQRLALANLALTDMRDAADTDDLKHLREEIASSQRALKEALARVDANSTEAVKTGTQQSVAWQEQANAFTDSGLRAASQQREGQLRDAVAALEESRSRMRTVSQQYLDQSAQIAAALDLDRSYQGTRSIVPSVDRLVAGESELRGALNDVAKKATALGKANVK